MFRNFISLLLVAIVTATLTQPAYAYLDPGMASMVLQGIVGGVAASAAVISLNYQRLKHFIKSKFGRQEDKAED